MRKELRVSTIYHSQYPVYNTLLDIERTMKIKKKMQSVEANTEMAQILSLENKENIINIFK